MLTSLLSAIPLEEALIRLTATALVIIVVTWSVELFGPMVGGVLAGLPITLGPGFYFLVAQAPGPFVAQAASYALLSLCATQCFLLAYVLVGRHATPVLTLMGAIVAWALTAAILHNLPSPLWLGGLLFVLTTVACLRIGRRAVRPAERATGRPGLSLLQRGLLAGLLVAGVTTTSHRLGATLSGLLLSFPIGYSVISITIHQHMGRDTATATLYSALLGTASLAVFCAVLALAIPHHTPYAALGLALASSALVTSALALWRRRSRS
jgi:hypothetical protein